MSQVSIFVNSKQPSMINYTKKPNIIPCGVDLNIFFPIKMSKSRKLLNLSLKKKYALFPSAFDNKVKNVELAKKAIELTDEKIVLLELKNLNRFEVSLYLNSVDFLLMTSKSEGSPQIVKEAMACNCPIVTVDVGDVSKIIGGTKNCYISEANPILLSKNITKVLNNANRTKGREIIDDYNIDKIANKINLLYQKVTN